MSVFILGLFVFSLISLLIFIPFGKQIHWEKNYRQQQNVALYQQQLSLKPNVELADELAQRLLIDEQQSEQELIGKTKSAVDFSKTFALVMWAIILIIPLSYYFSLQRFNYVQTGEKAFSHKKQQLKQDSAEKKNNDYVLSLQNQLRKDPNNAKKWVELGQAYMLNQETDFALIAYSNAAKIDGEKPYILGLVANAMYVQSAQNITPQIQSLLDRALQADPNETSSLSLLASNAFLIHDFDNALLYWQKLLDSERVEVNRREIIRNMNMAMMLKKNYAKQKAN